jgi:hypothetical protein
VVYTYRGDEMSSSLIRRFISATEDLLPVAGVSPGRYSWPSKVNHVVITNGTGQEVSLTADPNGDGVDLVTNGGFDADTDWDKDAPWSIAGGKAVAVDCWGGDCEQDIAGLVLNEIYVLVYTLEDYADGIFQPQLGGGVGTGVSANGTYTDAILVYNTSWPLRLRGASSFDGKIDNVKLYRSGTGPGPGGYDHKVANGAEIILTGGWHRRGLDSLGVWVPAGGTVADLNIRGVYIRGR